jgi:hypothetical protein
MLRSTVPLCGRSTPTPDRWGRSRWTDTHSAKLVTIVLSRISQSALCGRLKKWVPTFRRLPVSMTDFRFRSHLSFSHISATRDIIERRPAIASASAGSALDQHRLAARRIFGPTIFRFAGALCSPCLSSLSAILPRPARDQGTPIHPRRFVLDRRQTRIYIGSYQIIVRTITLYAGCV